jgi:hypothetical protein
LIERKDQVTGGLAWRREQQGRGDAGQRLGFVWFDVNELRRPAAGSA